MRFNLDSIQLVGPPQLGQPTTAFNAGHRFANLSVPFPEISDEAIALLVQPEWAVAFSWAEVRLAHIVGQVYVSVVYDEAVAAAR